jgi:DnaK suppressor protein
MIADIEIFKKKLEAELADLEKDLQSIGRRNPANPIDWEALPPQKIIDESDQVDVADDIEGYEENTAILKQLEIRYNEVKNALERIKNGRFGFCEVGGEEIETDRLLANPAATTCKKHLSS